MKKKFSCLFFACIAPFLLSGCPAAVVLSGASGAAVINDERSTGSFVEDYAIELKMRVQLSSDIDSNVNISITSYNRRLLLTGQAPTEALRQQVIDIAENIENVREILNQIEIAGAASLSSQASDSALTARVKAALCSIQIEDFSCLDVKVVNEKGVVYLLGLVNKKQAATAINTTRKIRGVVKVVKAFEFRE
ncbi:BON domain-containing protein [Candidatus Persebacteraceae bacterium Df01]|jgi:osmotically-inducible protein OsmY|uniref:BON domain-containing protein n=1 Tax=Candidatus Doriopsillibacter californiensis TaxID=2970740 RepID=A0ABT7QK36_9GAMM|nr:BON domain-containing protein [Candidatus Persebacteraceae bacterium Df01]